MFAAVLVFQLHFQLKSGVARLFRPLLHISLALAQDVSMELALSAGHTVSQ